MINFAKFINEAQETPKGDNPTALAKSFINMYNKMSNATYIYIDDMKFKNRYGSMTGSLFVSGVSALRVNFKNSVPFSVSKWNEFAFGKTPTKELLILNRTKTNRGGLTDIVPMLTDFDKSFELPDERRTFVMMPNSKILYDMQEVVLQLYYKYDMTNADDIISYIKKFASRYDEDFINAIVSIIEEEETADNSATPSVVSTKVREELEDEFPDEYIEYSAEEDMDTVEVEGADETIETDESAARNDEELAAQLVADPLPVFEKLNSYVLQIARGIDTALLITGQGGVGKSYNVNRILSAFGTKNKDYVIMKGNSTTAAMYKFLYDNYDKICVFDDCDAILEDTVGLNILKGALDSGDIREISWNTKGADMVDTFGCTSHDEIEARLEEWSAKHKGKTGTPNYFQFQGACIFISNKTVEEIAKLDAAILTRCSQVDINLLASEVMLRMKSVLPSIKVYNARGQDITKPDIKQEVFDYISSETFLKDPRMKGKKISFRLFNNTYKLRYGGSPKWKELAFGCC